MEKDRYFAFKKAQVENFVKKEFQRYFGRGGRISIRKRQRFMARVTQKVGKKFGKDILCLVDFTKQGFVSLISPSKMESTGKGKLYQSFTHPQVVYTTHCIDRFSERTHTTDNCIITLDSYLDEALLTYGLHEGYLVCSKGVFAFELENDRLVIKTYINFELLSDEQIKKFYSHDLAMFLTPDMISEDAASSDIIMVDELPTKPE
ncbi:MAG: hypothetical protein GWN44_03115 [Calditrichae bacterium]|nr:hypothetical protein [candidate division KSB1 bacterium]NIV71732.1 hypothetical protein [Calditrichia bacterium]